MPSHSSFQMQKTNHIESQVTVFLHKNSYYIFRWSSLKVLKYKYVIYTWILVLLDYSFKGLSNQGF